MPAIHRPSLTRDRFLHRFGHEPVRYGAALERGFSRGELDAAVRRGLLIRPRRGLLAVPVTDTNDGSRERHLALLASTLTGSEVDLVVAGESAAIVHGIATPGVVDPSSVTVVTTSGSGRRVRDERRRTAPLPESEHVEVDGLPCTSIARTAVDLARAQRLPSALIPLDSASRLLISQETGATGNRLRQLVREPEPRRMASQRLEQALRSCFGWAGTVAVRSALPFVDPCSESPLESRNRGWFLEAGLGPLNPGTPIRCVGSIYWADFCDPERRVIGEADGWSKYGSTDEEVRRALQQERERSDALQADGWRLVRWTSSHGRAAVVGRMTTALHPPPSAP